MHVTWHFWHSTLNPSQIRHKGSDVLHFGQLGLNLYSACGLIGRGIGRSTDPESNGGHNSSYPCSYVE